MAAPASVDALVRRRFFVEQFGTGSAALSGDRAEHLGRVLRAKPGQLYELSDGERVWLGRVERITLSKRGGSRVDFTLLEPLPAGETPPAIELLLAVVKFDRFEWGLEKATELGATEIIPLAAARTDKPLLAAAGKRRLRWERILLESAQQARRLRPPALGELTRPEGVFAKCRASSRILLSERPEALPMRQVLGLGGGLSSAALAIGPEGGWTEAEIAAAREAGFLEASLGENILRTETALVASLAILRFALGF